MNPGTVNKAAMLLYLDERGSEQADLGAAARAWRDGRVPETARARYRASVMAVSRVLAALDLAAGDVAGEDQAAANAVDVTQLRAAVEEATRARETAEAYAERDRQARKMAEQARDEARGEAQRARDDAQRKRVELRDARNDLLDVRGILAPNGQPRRVPMELGATVAPAVRWLVDELARVRDEADNATATLEEYRALLGAVRSEVAALAGERDDARAEAERLAAELAARPAPAGPPDPPYVPATRMPGIYWYRQRKSGTVTCDTTVPPGADLLYVPAHGGRQ